MVSAVSRQARDSVTTVFSSDVLGQDCSRSATSQCEIFPSFPPLPHPQDLSLTPPIDVAVLPKLHISRAPGAIKCLL